VLRVRRDCKTTNSVGGSLWVSADSGAIEWRQRGISRNVAVLLFTVTMVLKSNRKGDR
jgi:hypothetical protein